jgi:3-hydroxy acid dehydrogenase/malonic semialdehyde reductase
MNYKMALITGATAGIGEATARRLAEAGMNLFITGRRQERLEKLSSELKKKHSIEVVWACFDISDRTEVAEFVEASAKDLSKVDVLINNAGMARGRDPIQLGNIDDWDAMIDTNIKGLMYMTREVVPFLLKQKESHVINIGSVAGRWTYPGGGVYSATKFAVRAFSEGLRMDLIGKPVRVTNIEPGMVETEFSLVRFNDPEKAKSVYNGMTPLRAEDIAETIFWCLDRPKHVNIQEVVVFPTDQASTEHVHRRS